MNDNLYRYTFKFEPNSQFTCNAADLLEALKHLERATGIITYTDVEVTQIYRAPFLT
jgi:hypothetical protein